MGSHGTYGLGSQHHHQNLKTGNVVRAGVNIIDKHLKGLKNQVALGELSL